MPLLLFQTLIVGCGKRYDVDAWQARTAAAPPSGEAEPLDAELRRIEELRSAGDLAAARTLALSLVSEHPKNRKALYAASVAESDALLIFLPEEAEQRALAALSALDYAERALASERDDPSAALMAQYAWALGTSTHLQPMFARSEHAQRTLQAIENALESDPDQPRALATKALLNYRLATLPWIAQLMARGAPRGSLEEARSAADAATAAEPSIEYRLIRAKVAAASGDTEKARNIVEVALESPDRYPRDTASREPARLYLRELNGKGYPE